MSLAKAKPLLPVTIRAIAGFVAIGTSTSVLFVRVLRKLLVKLLNVLCVLVLILLALASGAEPTDLLEASDEIDCC